MCRYLPGGTAIHVAVFCQRSKKIIRKLLLYGMGSWNNCTCQCTSVGANPFFENDCGVTAWDISLLNRHSSSIEFSRFGTFEGLFYVKACPFSQHATDVFPWQSSHMCPSTSSRAFWVRIVPRYSWADSLTGKCTVGSRLYVHRRLLGETICEIDLEGCRAELISQGAGCMCNVLLVWAE